MKETWWNTLGKELDSKARGRAQGGDFCHCGHDSFWFLFSISDLYGLKEERRGKGDRARQAGLTSALLSHSRLFCLVVKMQEPRIQDAETPYSRVSNWSYKYHFSRCVTLGHFNYLFLCLRNLWNIKLMLGLHCFYSSLAPGLKNMYVFR